MYTNRTNASPTSNLEKGSTSEETKVDYEGTKQVDVSRSVCYGLTWTPSKDENLSTTKDTSPRSLSPPRSSNTTRINDRRGRYSFPTSYELSQFEVLSKVDHERCLEIRKTLSTRTSTTIAVSKDHHSYDYWLSGEKFFETPPSKNYNEEENDIHAIPTRDKSDNENIEEKTKDKELCHDLFKLSPKTVYDSDKSLLDKIDDLKITKETSDYGDAINKIRRSSSAFSASHVEKNVVTKNVDDQSSRSMIENVTSSTWNVLESVSTLGRTNVHNHIYLSSGYLDRYFDVPLSKILKLNRKKARVRCIRRRILKKPKRSRSRLVGDSCITSVIEMENIKSKKKEDEDLVFPLKSVFRILAEIDRDLSIYFKSVEKLQEQLPNYIRLEAIFTMENRRTLVEVEKRCSDYIRNNYHHPYAHTILDQHLSNVLRDLLDLVKKVVRAVLHEEQYYTQLKSVATFEKHDYQKIRRLLDDAEWYLSGGFRSSSSDWKESANKLLQVLMTRTNEICTVVYYKENIRKSMNRKRNDQDPTKKQLLSKLDDKATPIKQGKRYSIIKENNQEVLSLVPPMGNYKVSTKNHDGFRDQIKIKDIGGQRDRVLKENENRAERQWLAKPRKPVHTVWNNPVNRVNTGPNLENPIPITFRRNNNTVREKDSTTTSPTNGDSRRKRQNAYTPTYPAWKPGGAIKSISGSTSSFLHAEQPIRRTLNAVCDKENTDLMRSVPVKHANPSEPTVSGRNILKENRKNENFREERVTKLCKLLAQAKTQNGSKNGSNVLSETRSSTYTQSGVPLSDASGTKIGVKSSQINLSKQNSGSKPRPGVHRFNNFQRNTRTMFEVKPEPSQSKMNPINKSERNATSSECSVKFNPKVKVEDEDVLILLNDEDKLQNTQSSNTVDNELAKNTSETSSMSSNPPKSPETTLDLNSKINVDDDLRSESGQSFILLADASCNAEFSSTSNSTTMVPSTKCCQVSLSSTSTRTSLNYDRPYDKRQSIDVTTTIDKDSLESSTDDDSNYQTALGFDPRRQKSKHELSLNSLKDFLHDLGIDADVIQKVETKYELKKSNETSSSDLAKNVESPLTKTSSELDNQSTKTNEFKIDYIRSNESIESFTDSINVSTEKVDETVIERKKSKSSQTIPNLKEFCDASTDAEDMKSECSSYVDATVSCYELGLKTSSKDVSTEIFAEDNSILSPRRMVETQTKPPDSSTDNAVELGKEEEEKRDSDPSMATKDSKSEKSIYENENQKFQHENQGESFESVLNSEDSVTIDESPLSQCLIHQLEDIKEKLQNVDAQLNKLQEPAKETSDAFAQINTISSSIAPKSVGISTTSITSGISEECLEEFNIDFMKTNENCIPSDVVNAFYSIVWYASNWNEAIRIYRENSNAKRFGENIKDSTCSSSSDEVINVSKKTSFINSSYQFINENYCHPCDNEKTELDSGISSCFLERPSDVLNVSRTSDSSDESDETRSLASFGYDDFYEEAIIKPISQKSSRSSIFLETRDEIDKVQSSVNMEHESLEIMNHSERIQGFNENEGEQNVPEFHDDAPEFVLSREALLLLTYLTVCAFAFCCLKFSMTCESLIL